MKNNISKKIRLGIFISLGLAAFIAAIYFVGEKQQLFRSTFRISGVFKDVAGLQAGNNIRLSGINVGTVEDISIVSDTTVRVKMVIDEKIRKFIKKDAVASIGSEGLMGNKVLVITPGTGGKMKIENNSTIKTIQPINMDDILLSLKTTIDHTSQITSDLSKITTNVQSGKGTIGRLVMDQTWRQNFDSIFVDLREGSTGFKVLMGNANSINDILPSLKTTMDHTSNIAGDLSKITTNIQSGKGTIGRLLMDQSSAQNIDSAFANLKKGSVGFEKLMKKARNSWLLWGF
jgi:phospholipid/cholesterol/gamma-HCH transport system substrate-binding protein